MNSSFVLEFNWTIYTTIQLTCSMHSHPPKMEDTVIYNVLTKKIWNDVSCDEGNIIVMTLNKKR
jgi:hypothetical protein